MSKDASELRRGNAVRLAGELCLVVEMNHVKPGKGPAYLQGKLRAVESGTIREKRFRMSEQVETVFVERRKVTFSYRSGDDIVFLDDETFEEIQFTKDSIGPALRFLSEGEGIEVALADGDPIGLEWPEYLVRTVAETMDGVKSVKVTNQVKPAVLDTGVEIQVPIFIKQGESIRIHVESGKYHERAK
jgi:elongation factor P